MKKKEKIKLKNGKWREEDLGKHVHIYMRVILKKYMICLHD